MMYHIVMNGGSQKSRFFQMVFRSERLMYNEHQLEKQVDDITKKGGKK
jgi:hypothetical protein